MLKKTRGFLNLRPATQLLFLEALIFLGWARILKQIPFVRVAPSLGIHMEETSELLDPQQAAIIHKISKAINTMSNHTLWESQCMVMAIAGMKMLERRKIESTIYFGTGRDETGHLVAHAWLRSGSLYISGAETMNKFTIVSFFAKRINK